MLDYDEINKFEVYMFGKHPNVGLIDVVTFDDHFKDSDNPNITKAEVILLDNYPPKKHIGIVYQNQFNEWYYIADLDGVNLLGEVAYYC